MKPLQKCRVIVTYMPPNAVAGRSYKKGAILTLQPNVARILIDRGLVERVVDEPEFGEVETASMALADEVSPREPVRKRRKRRAVPQ